MREQDTTLTEWQDIQNHIQALLRNSSADGKVFDFGQGEGPYEKSLADMKTILDKSPDKDAGLWYVLLGEDDDQLTIAITGNGPHGEANARLLAQAPSIIRYLLGQVTELRQQLADAKLELGLKAYE